ncbi:MAG TPA: PAS domain S-box protein [Desulfuromonadaceae bacterium]
MFDDMTKDDLIRDLERSREKLGTCTLHNPTLCRCIYDVIQAGVVVHDQDAAVLFSNTKALEILGVDPTGLDGPEWSFFDETGGRIDPSDHPANRAIAERRPVEGVVVRYARPNSDDLRWLRMNAVPLIADGRLEQVVVSFVDITAEVTATDKLRESEECLRGTLAAYRESEECFRAIFENAVTGIILLLRSGQIVNANATVENMLGYSVDELKALNLWDISFPDDYESDRELLLDVIEGRRQYYQIEKRYVCQNGALIWGMLTASAVRDESGAPRFIVNMIEDISASKFAEEQLHYLNTHDSMTGLRNRSWFDEEFNRLFYGMAFPVSIITIDLDGLKQVNDTQGHEAGDALITGAATILKEAFGEQDIAARVGGDEFGVLLPATDEAAAAAAVERIRECQTRFNETRQDVRVSFSIGTATAHSSGKFAGIWKEADERMYAEKALHKRLRDT